MKKIAVVCGGYSGESAVSMRSAAMIMNNIDRTRYEPIQIVIEKERWYAMVDGQEIDVNKADFSLQLGGTHWKCDGVFMIIHGTPGENGIMQGYFEMLGIPTTTGDTLNMALTFNKKMTTRVLSTMQFKTARSISIQQHDAWTANRIIEEVGLPCFIKPNAGGSSIGTSKVIHLEDIEPAVIRAFQEDRMVMVEEFIQGVEVTCGVIQWQGKITALPITEIVSKTQFFDYEAKYQGLSEEITPARISEELTATIQSLAASIYTQLNCRGMIRVDFIIQNDIPHVIEVNTTPGFSEASIIPQQAAAKGISKSELIEAVIESCF
ncbi:MAG: D-alanine--D-alanine ligase [Flavobacteriales bacterium]